MSAICKLPKKNPAETVISKRPDARNGCLSHSISHRSFPFSTPARASRACHAMSQRRFPFSTTVAAASLPVCGCLSSVSASTSGFHSCCCCHYNRQNFSALRGFAYLVSQTVSYLTIYLFITAFLISFDSLSQHTIHTLQLYLVLLWLTFTDVSALFLFLCLLMLTLCSFSALFGGV